MGVCRLTAIIQLIELGIVTTRSDVRRIEVVSRQISTGNNTNTTKYYIYST